MTKKNKLIVVLGMHRSGTSSITRGLQVLGVELGDRMMPPVEGINDKGFWEDVDLTDLNVEILKAIGSDWNCLTPITSNDVKYLHKQRFFERAVEMLQKKVGSTLIYGFKDPRVAKLLPFWREVFTHCQFDVSYVLAIRHPLSVAESLLKRNGFEREHSYLLWLGHVITSLTYSVDSNRVLVDYDLLMQNPENELNRIAKQLNLNMDQTSLQSYMTDFLDQELRHSMFRINDLMLDDCCPDLVNEIYIELLNVATDKTLLTDAELIHKIGRWSKEIEKPEISLQFVDKILRLTTVQTVLERKVEISRLANALSENIIKNTELNQRITELKQRIEFYEAEIARRHQSNSLQNILLDEFREEVRQFRTSTSWRITSPLRTISHGIKLIIQFKGVLKTYFQTFPSPKNAMVLFKKSLILIKSGDIKQLREKIANYEVALNEKIKFEIENPTDPIKNLHTQLKKDRMSTCTIIFDHNGGGGANIYTSEIIKKIILKKEHVLRVYFFKAIWFVQWVSEDANLLFSTPSTELLFDVLLDSPSTDIILNSLYGYPDITLTTNKIISLAAALDAKIDFKIHDFYPLCPSPHLSDFEEKYCGVPQDVETCKKCLKTNVNWYHPWFPEKNRPIEIVQWRKPFAELLDCATVVTFFDKSSIDILKKGFKLNDKKLKIVPHSNSYFNCETNIDIDGPLHIGVFGTLSHIKGGNVVKELCEFIESQGLAIPVTIVGRSFTKLPSFVDVHGAYNTNELPEIVSSKGINIMLMFSIIPETFSYTISEAIQMELPIVAFDIGAQGNRVRNYQMGSIVPMHSKPEAILKVIQSTLADAQELKIKC